nr:hypothetical protein [Candidatus Sigynarchaeota archaeon]
MAIGAVSKKGQYIVVNGVLCLGLAQVPVSVRPFISARITAVMVGEIATAVFCLLIMLWIFARVRGNLRKHVQWVFYEVEGVLSILLAITFYISVDLDVGWIRFLLYSAFVLPLCGIVFLAKEFLKQRRNFLVLLL